MARNHSPERLRRQLTALFDREIAGMKLLPELTFTWDMSGRAASVRRLPTRRLRAEINLRVLGGASEFDLRFCACAVAAALRLWETASSGRFESYLHGLACIEALARSRAGRCSLFLPLGGDGLPRVFTAADLYCALSGMRRVQELYGGGSVALRETLEALAPVPEVVWLGRKLPESSFVRCLREIETLRGRPAAEELLTRGDPLSCGLVLRMMAFGEERLPDPEAVDALETELHSVRRHSVDFIRRYGSERDGALRDELLALERLNAALNRMGERMGIPVRTGVVHPLIRG